VGPRLPGADAEPLYETRGRGGSSNTLVSPLVDIRSRLTNQSRSVLFVVEADAESYWRSSALPRFDGTTWGLPEQPLAPTGAGAPTPAPGAVELRHTVTVNNLTGRLVPAAADPINASGRSDLRWDPETSTIVTVDGDLERGDVIDIRSASPRFTEAALDAATSDDPGDPIYTELPDDLPEIVATTARQATAGHRSTFEAARLLQMWFQREFRYSLEVQPGHSGSAIENFLRERVGYCEQFAGTYAAMMRTLGYPSRVAVGFTPGVARQDGTLEVQGRHAHAWPEVWFDGLGWVPFEPTPQRGAPNADYTGLEPQQESDAQEGTAAPGDADVTPVTVAPFDPDQDLLGLDLPEEFADPSGADGAIGAGSSEGGSTNWWPVFGVLAVALVLAAPAGIREFRARRRRTDPAQEVAALWHRSVESLVDAGVPVQPSDTPLETARVTAVHLPIVARPVSSLATAVTEAHFAPEGADGYDEPSIYGGSVLSNCANWSRQIDRAVDDTVAWPTRIKRYFTDLG
jgi:transglutaminase-like putative cysteine protease